MDRAMRGETGRFAASGTFARANVGNVWVRWSCPNLFHNDEREVAAGGMFLRLQSLLFDVLLWEYRDLS